jgi:excinuclease ABC subunit C
VADELFYRPKTGDIPTAPGVYRFFVDDRVLYVGKAKNLRARLTSYFAPLATLHERTRRMVTTANRVEWVIVGSEFEALQLEFTWIKEFNPPFNIQFMDDKSYPYLAIGLGDRVPRAYVTRRRGHKGAVYFGPYTKTWAIRETLDTILKPFPVRTCSDSSFEAAKRNKRPCLLGDIGKCAAPCVGRVSEEDHKQIAVSMAHFLQGKDDNVISVLEERMLAASENHDYERAAKLRDSIVALQTVAEKSVVVLPSEVDADVYGLARDAVCAAVHQFIVRGGRVRGARSWTVDVDDFVSSGELMDDLLRSAYAEDLPPKLIVLPELPGDARSLEQWLRRQREDLSGDSRVSAIELRVAMRGDMARLAQTVTTNAEHALVLYKSKRAQDYLTRSAALGEIAEALGLDKAPLRIECYDISHLGGENIVGSMVVFEDGLAKKADYRSFNIAQAADDTSALGQVLDRRLSYLGTDTDAKSFSYPPGLMLIDGGLPQVNAAAAALARAGLNIPVCGIAKRLEELWLPGGAFPVILPRNSQALFLLQQVRDEAHRFAIKHQRKKRSQSIASVLDDVPGLGPVKIKQLLKTFGSVTRLRAATTDELASISGITPELAERIISVISPDAP